MSRTLRRGAVAALILATAPILAACAAGDNAATSQVKPDNAATSIATANGSIKLNGIAVVTDATGNAPANILANIANADTKIEDSLTGVAVDGTPAVLGGQLQLNPLNSILLSGSKSSAVVPTLNEKPGQNATITFTFAKAGSVTVKALVSTGTGDYASYAPAPAQPTAASTPSAAVPSASGSASTKPGKPAKSGGASATPSSTTTP